MNIRNITAGAELLASSLLLAACASLQTESQYSAQMAAVPFSAKP